MEGMIVVEQCYDTLMLNWTLSPWVAYSWSWALHWYVKHTIEMATLNGDIQACRCNIKLYFIYCGHRYIHIFTVKKDKNIFFMPFVHTPLPLVHPHPQSPIDTSLCCNWMWLCEWTNCWRNQSCTNTWTLIKIVCMKPIGPSFQLPKMTSSQSRDKCIATNMQ